MSEPLAAAPHAPAETEATAPHDPRLDRVERLSLDEFRSRYFRRKRPVLITGMAQDWPALGKWSFAFFRDLADDRNVTIEMGNVLQGQTAFEKSSFRGYVEQLMAPQPSESAGGQGRRYLSLFNIFEQFPALRDDVDFSLLTSLTRWHYTFGWLGPKGTLTGYHIDWIDNILAQIQGRKQLWLVPPDLSYCMYPSSKYDFRSTLSQVDPDSWDRRRFPLFEQVRPIPVVLEPGQMLFIPRGWWHRVQSLDPSISVNTFAHDLSGILIHQSWAKLKDHLHRSGLVGRGHCTCHMDTNRHRIGKPAA